jgi:glutaredoxin 3
MPPIVLYTTPTCSYCAAAKALLKRKGAPFTEINIEGARDKRREMEKRSNGGMTVPQIFIGADHIGGCDDLYALDKAGKLDALLAAG